MTPMLFYLVGFAIAFLCGWKIMTHRGDVYPDNVLMVACLLFGLLSWLMVALFVIVEVVGLCLSVYVWYLEWRYQRERKKMLALIAQVIAGDERIQAQVKARKVRVTTDYTDRN